MPSVRVEFYKEGGGRVIATDNLVGGLVIDREVDRGEIIEVEIAAELEIDGIDPSVSFVEQP